MESILLFFLTVAFYLIPTFIALLKNKKHTFGISVLNVVGGFFFPLWLGALAWAALDKTNTTSS
jgi:hypothetical protein